MYRGVIECNYPTCFMISCTKGFFLCKIGFQFAFSLCGISGIFFELFRVNFWSFKLNSPKVMSHIDVRSFKRLWQLLPLWIYGIIQENCCWKKEEKKIKRVKRNNLLYQLLRIEIWTQIHNVSSQNACAPWDVMKIRNQRM